MKDDCCTTSAKSTKIKVQENGKQAIFLNPEKSVFRTTRVDGCLVQEATACDFLVRRKSPNSTDVEDGVVIELKGKDVAHALEQIEATIKFLKSENQVLGRVAALIVCRRPSKHPSFTAKLQKARARLSVSYKAPLHIVTENLEFDFERMFSHQRPR